MTFGRHENFEINEIVSTTFSIWSKNFLHFFAIYFVCALPIFILQMALFLESGVTGSSYQSLLATGSPQYMDFGGAMALRLVVIFVLSVVSYVLVNGAVTYSVLKLLDGRDTTSVQAIMVALRYVVPLLLISILSSTLVGLGMLLVVVPGIIVAIILSVAVPACVTERLGVLEAMGRSARLTKEFRWKTFFALAVLLAVLIILQIGVSFVLSLAFAGVSLSLFAQQLLDLVFAAIFQPLLPIATAVLYVKLIGIKEGRPASELADAFD